MQVKDLLELLQHADPEAVIVNFYTDENSCMPVEEVFLGSLCVKPKWASGGQIIVDGGALAKDEDSKILMGLKDVIIYPAICFK